MNVTVIGDVLLDVDLEGDVERLTPYAPVPVVDVGSAVRRAGGAGLVARMLERDGHDVTLVTALADDERAAEIRAELGGIRLVAGRSPSPTVVKTRLRSREQPIARIDEGSARPEAPEVTDAMLDAVRTADLVVASDYGRRLLEDAGLRAEIERAALHVPVVWDPHARGVAPVAGVVATPNLGEARAFLERTRSGIASSGVAFADDAAKHLRDEWSARAVVVTMGARGALLEAGGGGLPFVAAAAAVAEADVNGAGDRFASALAAALGGGADLADAVVRTVHVTAAFLADGGVAALAAGAAPSVASPAHDAIAVVERVRAAGGTVVATGGCFDLLHAGHARTLSAARALGDCLIVCLNSDASVSRLKGPGRPILGEEDRVDLLNALEMVDGVLVFTEDTPVEAIRLLRPDIWVKGGDYRAADLPEAAVIREWGGRAVTVPYVPGHSTTQLAAALAAVG